MSLVLASKTHMKRVKNCKNRTMLEKRKHTSFAVQGLISREWIIILGKVTKNDTYYTKKMWKSYPIFLWSLMKLGTEKFQMDSTFESFLLLTKAGLSLKILQTILGHWSLSIHPWQDQDTSGFLMFSGIIKWGQ